jgi:cell division cycle 14
VTLGWFRLSSFDAQFYEHHEQVENGDFNWILPGKFLAFSNPATTPNDVYGFRMWTPREYIPVFKKLGISTVIRLNNRTYDETIFKKGGIAHYDLFFVDGSCPPPEIAERFLQITEAA